MTEQISKNAAKPGVLQGLRVIEFADEMAEHCGLLMAGMGAEVIKVEPHGGSPTRHIGPFLDDRPDPEGSLHFWHYNRNKRSVELPADDAVAGRMLLELIASADILLDSSCGRLNRLIGLERAALATRFPALIVARMTPFGDTGPWKDFKSSDLIHLALGGVMMNCGYDPDPTGRYDLPPMAPQLWHAYHIAGDHLAIGVVAALVHRLHTGRGQDVSCAVHEAVSKATEVDLMNWVMRRAPVYRQTSRHAAEVTNRVPAICYTKDGRWIMTWGVSARDEANLVPFLKRYGMEADLVPPASNVDLKARAIPGTVTIDERMSHRLEVIQRFVRSYTYANMPWREAQDAGLLWTPIRKPHENAEDPHWLARGTFTDIHHPDLGRSFRYVTSKWLSTATEWKVGTPAPKRGEANAEFVAGHFARTAGPDNAGKAVKCSALAQPVVSVRGKPFPLQGIRIFDFSWFLASAGGTRIAAAMGAEVLKVEWKDNPDTRLAAMAPPGGRAERDAATAPLKGVTDPDMGGQFNNKNSGKRGLSLNIRTPEGMAIARRLIAMSDIVCEGFSPGVLDRLGLGYEELKKIKPDIIYVQQSGTGSAGTMGRFRTVGPVAASFAGTTDMSGLPEPAMPAGIGYSYLDWMGAYGFALAILSAVFHRDRTGEGQYIDSSQCEAGLFLAGPTVLDWSANGRPWLRIGNRSPYKPAAPHGAYRCTGEDRWLAIACFDEAEWQAFTGVAGLQALRSDARFATLTARLAHQEALDAAVNAWSEGQDAHAAMLALQQAGVPAGVCQTAGDRCDTDPQLRALEWLSEVKGTKIGRWPVVEMPAKLSETPAWSGGPIDRAAPCYGEDNHHVLTQWLGYSDADVERLARENVI